MTVNTWSQTAAENATADSTINIPEGMSPGTVNDTMRAMMAAMAKFRDDLSGNLVTAGTSAAYTLTTNQSFTSLTDGLCVHARASATNDADATINIDSLGSKQLLSDSTPTNVNASVLVVGRVYKFTYDSTADGWIVSSALTPDVIPVGTVSDFAGTTAPDRWLLAYGQEVSRTTYALAFAVLGETYGAGDSSTTFNLPDLRGRVTAGKDDMGGTSADRLTDQTGGVNGDTIGDTGGAETHTLLTAELAAHTHGAGTYTAASDGAHTHVQTINGYDWNTVPQGSHSTGSISSHTDKASTASTQSGGTHTHSITGSSASSGSDTAHNNVQPTIILNKIIYMGV